MILQTTTNQKERSIESLGTRGMIGRSMPKIPCQERSARQLGPSFTKPMEFAWTPNDRETSRPSR